MEPPAPGPEDREWVDLTHPEYLDGFERAQSGPVYAVPTMLPSWNRVCGGDGGGRGPARGWLVVIGGNPGFGKAMALDTPLPTPTGWTTMGDVQPGDTLFDERGHPCRVLVVKEVLVGRPCYEVTFADGARLVTDEDHLWMTLRRVGTNGKRAWGLRTTWEIGATLTTPDGKHAHSVPCTGALEQPDAELPIHPYVLGAWLGDGASRAAEITVGAGGEQVLEEIRACGETVRKLKNPLQWTMSRGRGRHVGGFRARLTALGVFGNKHIPRAYLRASAAQRLALLQGLMDTDGYCSGATGSCEFTTTSELLRNGMAELLASLGFQFGLGEGRATIDGRDCGPKYRLTFTAYSDRPVFRIRRKRENQPARPKGQHHLRTTHRTIVSVNPVPSRPVRCIAVDSPSHLFLAGERMVPTHNTLLALLVAREALKARERAAFVSMEMHHHQLAARFYAMATGTDTHRLEKGRFDPDAMDAARGMVRKLFPTGGLQVNAKPLFRLGDVQQSLNRLADEGVKVFLVDYLQLIGVGDEESINRQVTEAITWLRVFAVERQALVITLSQFNRGTAGNYADTPRAQGLHGGMIIEACADQVVLLDHSRYEKLENRLARTWLTLDKNRHGDRVEIPILWNFNQLTAREGLDDERGQWPSHD